MSRKFKIRRKRGPTVAKVFPVTGRPGHGFKKFTRAHVLPATCKQRPWIEYWWYKMSDRRPLPPTQWFTNGILGYTKQTIQD